MARRGISSQRQRSTDRTYVHLHLPERHLAQIHGPPIYVIQISSSLRTSCPMLLNGDNAIGVPQAVIRSPTATREALLVLWLDAGQWSERPFTEASRRRRRSEPTPHFKGCRRATVMNLTHDAHDAKPGTLSSVSPRDVPTECQPHQAGTLRRETVTSSFDSQQSRNSPHLVRCRLVSVHRLAHAYLRIPGQHPQYVHWRRPLFRDLFSY